MLSCLYAFKSSIFKGNRRYSEKLQIASLTPFFASLIPPFYLKPNQNQIKTVEGVIGGRSPPKN